MIEPEVREKLKCLVDEQILLYRRRRGEIPFDSPHADLFFEFELYSDDLAGIALTLAERGRLDHRQWTWWRSTGRNSLYSWPTLIRLMQDESMQMELPETWNAFSACRELHMLLRRLLDAENETMR